MTLKERWHSTGGYREVLHIALPLVLSTASWSVQHFVDRMFLSWYSPETIAAAMPAGMLHFSIASVFMGTAGYVSTFVAQYHGARQYDRIGHAIWQGVYISLIGGLALISLYPFSEAIFGWIGHADPVQRQEVIYFKILCFAGAPYMAAYALSGFFSGRGKTWPVMWVNTFATAVNLLLDYVLIFGNWGFPEMGIKGAGLATVLAGVISLCVYLWLIVDSKTDAVFHTLKGWRLEKILMLRVLRFGLPSGVQFFLEMAGFTGFILIVGRLGTTSLAATNIAFNINTLAFMPMIGCGMAVSILVGQYLGADNPKLAQFSTYSGFHLAFLYMGSIAAAYLLLPDLFVVPFALNADPAKFQAVYDFSIILLRFVALYSLFDTLNIIFCSAIKGAGDTRFVMYISVMLSFVGLLLPTYLAVVVLDFGLMVCWSLATLYVILLGIAFWLRFLSGQWKTMRVIEPAAAVKTPPPQKVGKPVNL
jgi:MATE family multidrug resistance protein